MTNVEFKILLVLHASTRPLNGLQIKRVGRYWMLPWQHLFNLHAAGLITSEQRAIHSYDGVPPSTYYSISVQGEAELGLEVERRARV
jgi:hypothetical protein